MTANLIGGEWVGAASGRRTERHNPADTRRLVATAPDSGAEDVRAAVDAVAQAWPEWAAAGPERRAEVLGAAAAVLERDPEKLAAELVAEEGKTFAEALGEVRRTPANLRYYASEALRLTGHTYPARSGLVYTARQPVGVIAAITPWNFPLNIPSRKLGPALAAGNGVVFKPSEVTPVLARRLTEALLEAGLPAGVLALVHGGADTGAALVADPRVAAVTFTGSTAVGERIHAAVGPSRRTQLELGGKNAVLVLDDADLDRAADIVVRGAFGLTGQACTGTSRVIAHDAVHDDLLRRVVARAERLVPGDGLAEGVQLGPLATREQYDKVRRYVRLGLDEGALLHTGGEPPGGAATAHGYFLRPAVFSGVAPDSRLAQDEVFGPVLAFLRVHSFDEAVSVADATPYGLSTGIVTGDLRRALEFAERVRSGLVKVNQPTTGMAMNAPFGGLKASSTQTSKEQAGAQMSHFYTTEKTVYVSP
ncbi:aldehyde dehydrogenase family protein [Prauserella muralis]|uniref:Aldehyde dehydrogenase n=1 Tax=Prauserella muralis TaxID=588067 RepID=A0A2V4AQ27_9PSEU|nr:aldehyde dehydrogenase family protein [Prauserella muralis]PXY22810.1 aldehyde dehydrogenase [Prauserella muralis]TWE28558.1 aldehyde dehydrogenase (NAD+) [Prauserella muralis]